MNKALNWNLVGNGIYPIADILQYKPFFTQIPQSIIEHNIKNNIIMVIPTNEAVTNRQKHPVLKKLGNIKEISSNIISSLNKVSDDNMDDIVKNISKIENITTHDGITEFANIISKKVSTEKNFVHIYARLCVKMSTLKTNDEKPISLITLISAKCKELFDKYITFVDIEKTGDNLEEKQKEFAVTHGNLIDIEYNLDKMKVLNQTTFIGYLYNFGILRKSAIDYCIDKLISQMKTVKFCAESLTTILKVIIQKYSKEDPQTLKIYYERLKEIQCSCMSFRDRFLIQDLLEKNEI